jgi:hypothetical protein
VEISEVKIADDRPAGWQFAMDIASVIEVDVISVSRGAKDSDK